LEQSRADDFYRQLIEGWPDAVLVFDFEQRRYLFVNGAAERLTGYRREEILRLQPGDLAAPEFVREIPRIAAILERDGQHRRPWRVRRKDGSLVDTEVTLTQRRVGGRMVSQGLLRVVTDGQRNGKETDIRAKILEGTDQAMVLMDSHGVVVDWNHAAEDLFGWPSSEAIGRHVVSLVPEGAARDEVASLLSRMQHGELLAGELPAFRRTGEPVKRTATISPIRGDAGEVIGFLSVSVPSTSNGTQGVRMRRARVQCVACGREVAGTMRRKYCSEKCRQWAYYHRHVEAQRARSRERHERRRAAQAEQAAAKAEPQPVAAEST